MNRPRQLVLTSLAAVVCLAAAPQASAQGWSWTAEIYGWMPKISSTTQSGFEADLDFDSILEDLNFTFMGNIAAKKGRWTLYGDLIYLNIEDSDEGTIQLGPFTIDDELDWNLRTVIGTVGASYEVSASDSYNFNVLGGARYLWMDVDVDLTVGPITGSASDDEAYLDGFVGFQGTVDLADKWYLFYHADVGTGQTDLTWQAVAAVYYRFEKFDLAVGYRHREWHFDDDEPLNKLTVDGPYVGVRFRF